MLTFAIATFFALATIAALLVIGTMFQEYHAKIKNVILLELTEFSNQSATQPTTYRRREIKTRHVMAQHRSLRTSPLRAAA